MNNVVPFRSGEPTPAAHPAPDDVDSAEHLRQCLKRLSLARSFLRLLEVMIDDDGKPTVTHRDLLNHLIRIQVEIREGTIILFNISDPDNRYQKHLLDLFDTYDVVTLAVRASRDRLPSGEGLTTCPVQSSMQMVNARLSKTWRALARLNS